MKSIGSKIYENVIKTFGTILLIPTMFYLIIVTFTIVAGLLFGYENPSPICFKVKHSEMTRADYLVFPVAGYACREGAGLLQPYASNLAGYLNEVPGEKK